MLAGLARPSPMLVRHQPQAAPKPAPPATPGAATQPPRPGRRQREPDAPRRPRGRRRTGRRGARRTGWHAPATTCVVVERKTFPREKTCGDGLTPRAVHQLEDMGLGAALTRFHRYDGLRASPTASRSNCSGPSTPSSRPTATSCAGATSTRWSPTTRSPPARCVREGTEAIAPVARRRARARRGREGQGDGRDRRRSDARYVVVADGANSRFGRALGTARNRALPAGHGDPRLLREPAARRPVDRVRARRARPQRRLAARLRLDLPGGRRHHQRRHRPAVDVPRLEARQHVAPAWTSSPRPRRRTGASRPTASCGPPTGGRLPMGGSVDAERRARPGCVVGDAAGTINPFNGEGIDYAYETGRMAAGLLDEALDDRRRHGAAALPAPARRRSTASTSRWPGCSPR